MGSNAAQEADFRELSDGSLVEMIEDPTDPTKTLFAAYSDGCVRYTDRIDDAGRILVPLSRVVDDGVRHVCLAQGAEAYRSAEDLGMDLIRLLGLCLDLEVEWKVLTAAFVISTWLPEKLPVAPYLALVGPPGSGKTTAMRLLSLLCYRGLMTADISSPAFYDISHRIRPTILLDETLTAGRPRELIHLLKASSTPGCVSLRRGKAQLAYGPKVFAWLEPPNDSALNSRCVIVPMRKTSRTNLQAVSSPEILGFAKRFRMRLLQFRFASFRNVSMPEAPSDLQLSGRPLDLYRVLAFPFGPETETAKFVGLMIAAQDQRQAHAVSPVQASTIRVLYTSIHDFPDSYGFKMSGLTASVNSDLANCGEPHRLNERKLGDILTSLSFTNRTRKNSGYVLLLDRSTRARIHAAARDYGVEGTSAELIENCEICARANSPAATAAAIGAQTEKIRSENAKGERRERRERQSRRLRARRRN